MLKRIFSIFALYLALIPLSTIPSCEDWLVHEATICGIDFSATEEGFWGIIPDSIPVLEDEIMFLVWARSFEPQCMRPKLELVSTAYATSPCYRFTNSLAQSTYELSFNRPFVFQNDTIPAGTDLFRQPEIATQIETIIDENCDWYTSTITFMPALRNACVFETGEYEVNFRCKTSDDKAFNESTRVIFEP